MSDHAAGHGGHEKKEFSLTKILKQIGVGILVLFIVIIIGSMVFRSCYKSDSKNGDSSEGSKNESQAQPFSKTIEVSFGTSYGEPTYLPAGYDFSFLQKSGGEYCVKNSQGEYCGHGDVSSKIPGGAHNTEGLWFKGEKEGSLEILLVKNNNL